MLTPLGSVGVAVIAANVIAPVRDWVLPNPEFFAGLGVGVLAAFVVSLLALPFMDGATRYDSIRIE